MCAGDCHLQEGAIACKVVASHISCEALAACNKGGGEAPGGISSATIWHAALAVGLALKARGRLVSGVLALAVAVGRNEGATVHRRTGTAYSGARAEVLHWGWWSGAVGLGIADPPANVVVPTFVRIHAFQSRAELAGRDCLGRGVARSEAFPRREAAALALAPLQGARVRVVGDVPACVFEVAHSDRRHHG